MHNDLTQEELKVILSYDPETGLFTRLVGRNNQCKVGDIAGGTDAGRYWKIRVNSTRYKAHRLAFLYMTGSFPLEEVDHINGIESDNRWANLRAVSHAENSRNQRLRSTNKSGVMGVSWSRKRKKWCADLRSDGKKVYVGFFDSKEEAVAARLQAEKDHDFHENHGRVAGDTAASKAIDNQRDRYRLFGEGALSPKFKNLTSGQTA